MQRVEQVKSFTCRQPYLRFPQACIAVVVLQVSTAPADQIRECIELLESPERYVQGAVATVRVNGHPLILLIAGHISRWHGLMKVCYACKIMTILFDYTHLHANYVVRMWRGWCEDVARMKWGWCGWDEDMVMMGWGRCEDVVRMWRGWGEDDGEDLSLRECRRACDPQRRVSLEEIDEW